MTPSPHHRIAPEPALFFAVAPAVVLAVFWLGLPLLLGLFLSFAALPFGLVFLPVAGGGLLGLAAMVRLCFASLGQRGAPAWAVVGTTVGLVVAAGFFVVGMSPAVAGHAGDTSAVTLHRGIALAMIAGMVLLARQWMPAAAVHGIARGGLCIAVVWAASIAAVAWLPGALGHASRSAAVAASQKIHTDIADPFVQALCAGELDRARAMLADHEVRATARLGVSECLHHWTWIDPSHEGDVFHEDRVGLALDGIVAAERAAGIDAAKGCTEYQIRLMTALLHDRPPMLRAFVDRQLPLDCVDGPERTPVWWRFVYGARDGRAIVDGLQLLKTLGIDLAQRDAVGLELLGEDVNNFISQLSDEQLLAVLELGLDARPPGQHDNPLALGVAIRRFREGAPQEPGPALKQLQARVGEPSRAQLLDMADAGFDPWGDGAAFHAYLDARLAGVSARSVHGTAVDSPNTRLFLLRLRCQVRDCDPGERPGPSIPDDPAPPPPVVAPGLREHDYRYHQIRVETAARAQRVIDALKAGHAFERMSVRYSLDPPDMGSIAMVNWSAGRTLPAQVLAALGTLQPGEFTRAPVRMGDRFVVVMLDAVRPSAGAASAATP